MILLGLACLPESFRLCLTQLSSSRAMEKDKISPGHQKLLAKSIWSLKFWGLSLVGFKSNSKALHPNGSVAAASLDAAKLIGLSRRFTDSSIWIILESACRQHRCHINIRHCRTAKFVSSKHMVSFAGAFLGRTPTVSTLLSIGLMLCASPICILSNRLLVCTFLSSF